MQLVYDHLALPESAYLGKRVYKKLFFDNAEMSAADRRAFSEDIDSITWQYTLKPSTLNVNAYRDEERDYSELAVIDLALRAPNRVTRLAELVHRAIPYPFFLVVHHDQQFAVSTAHKRASKAEAGVVVAEDLRLTRWMNTDVLEAVEQAFLESLAISGLPQTHYYAVYAAWHQRLLALACARLSHTFRVPTRHEDQTAQRERLAACHRLETEIARLRAEIKKETRFNRQVELNTRIKGLEQQLHQIVADL